MEQLPNIVRERLKATVAGDHPDPDLLTAFAEQALPAQERSRVLLHLSRCADCRDVLALAVPPATVPESLDTARPSRWFQWKVLRWGAAVACVVIVGSAVLMRREAMTIGKVATVRQDVQADVYKDEQALETPSSAARTKADSSTSIAMEPNAKKVLAPRQNEELRAVAPALASPSAAMHGNAPFEEKQIVVQGMRSRAASGGVMNSMVTRPAEAPQAPSSMPAKEDSKGAVVDARNMTDMAVLAKGASETVEVQSAAPVIETDNARSEDKQEALGRAKPASGAVPASGAMLDAMKSSVAAPGYQAGSAGETLGQKMERSKLKRLPATRWTISSDGQLQHSIDSGQTWQPVSIAEKASFRALSANGPDVWVGGASGLLYHSTDSGASWAQVKPSSGEARLTANIAAIEFTDLLHGKVTTSNGESWTTEDAGQTWHKQP